MHLESHSIYAAMDTANQHCMVATATGKRFRERPVRCSSLKFVCSTSSPREGVPNTTWELATHHLAVKYPCCMYLHMVGSLNYWALGHGSQDSRPP